MKKLLIIGNADVTGNCTNRVNSFDAVIRINLRNIYNVMHGTTGTKTDVLCYSPSALKRVMNNEKDLKSIEGYCRNVSHVWFLRPRRAYWINRAFLYGFLFSKERLFLDISSSFIRRMHLRRSRIEYVAADFVHSTANKLWSMNPGDRSPLPSAGFMTIEKALADDQWREYEKYLLGFTFEGWQGHPWESEKKLVEGYRGKGLLSFLPET